jgi:hypothetical protein
VLVHGTATEAPFLQFAGGPCSSGLQQSVPMVVLCAFNKVQMDSRGLCCGEQTVVAVLRGVLFSLWDMLRCLSGGTLWRRRAIAHGDSL